MSPPPVAAAADCRQKRRRFIATAVFRSIATYHRHRRQDTETRLEQNTSPRSFPNMPRHHERCFVMPPPPFRRIQAVIAGAVSSGVRKEARAEAEKSSGAQKHGSSAACLSPLPRYSFRRRHHQSVVHDIHTDDHITPRDQRQYE